MVIIPLKKGFLILFLAALLFSAVLGAQQSVRGGGVAAVTIGDSNFSPQELTVTLDTTVVWTNMGTNNYTVTSDNGAWSSVLLVPKGTFSLNFTNLGIFPYHSNTNPPTLTGKIIVIPTSSPVISPGTPNTGQIALYSLSIAAALVLLLWLNYPSAKSKARMK